jgi:cytochrome c peroxidase
MKFYITPLAAIVLAFLLSAGSVNSEKPQRPKTKAALGKRLFFDTILSKNYSLSCASCHKPEYAFADNLPFSFGLDSSKTERNTPSVMNLLYQPYFFWDGRAATLMEQALMPIEHPGEMGLPVDEAIERLNNHPEYSVYFRKIFKSPANLKNLGEALAAFQETLETSDTPFDRWMQDKPGAMDEAAQRGLKIFNEKAKCFDCHFGPDFTSDEFRNIGLYNGKELNDPGRFKISADSADLGKFKVPGLRNIAVTAPYMHNGMFKTLREVIDYYDDPKQFVNNSINIDSLMLEPLRLTEQEKIDLEAFMKALTDKRYNL